MRYADLVTVTKQIIDEEYGDGYYEPQPDGLYQAQYMTPYEALSPFAKGDDTLFTFSKVDTDAQQVFGWASVVTKNGEPVLDRQQDLIEISELEKSAYDFMLKADGRIGSVMHQRDGAVSKSPKVVSQMIESMVFTPEKIEKMGLPADYPQGWWVGYQVTDPEVWGGVKSGKWNSFSVHGVGKRKDV